MLDIRYIAGIIDGEGSIQLKVESRNGVYRLYPTVVVKMTNYKLVKTLHEEFGGSFSTIKSDGVRKISYVWQLANTTNKLFLEKLLPYLIVKKEQANLVLDYYHLANNSNMAMNNFFREQMTLLNKRGV